ncbi:hypothetical protein OF381_02220 [Mannheimia haemolytica]
MFNPPKLNLKRKLPPKKPSLQDDNSNARRTVSDSEAEALLQPGFGFSAKIPRRNLRPFPKGGGKMQRLLAI